ncbi:MAG: hypothetical protein K9K80_02675 [Spirochaetia bacterium]|nr:hypothetical protein [Spirochaetia bacterium]MCF7953609.1 hypothetical protein [Spirochaetales bacterium]
MIADEDKQEYIEENLIYVPGYLHSLFKNFSISGKDNFHSSDLLWKIGNKIMQIYGLIPAVSPISSGTRVLKNLS